MDEAVRELLLRMRVLGTHVDVDGVLKARMGG